jgi:hypothetical protein
MKKITIDQLRHINTTESLILQGCGGNLYEWVDGISEMLAKENILLEGDTFKNVSVFEHDGLTNLFFSLEKVKLDWNKLAMWRLQTHDNFGGTWLSDYVPNRLGDFIIEKEQSKQNKKIPPNTLASEIADFIVKNGSLNTTEGNYIHYNDILAKQFGVDEKDIDAIKEDIKSELYEHEEVADVYLEPDGGFDVCYHLAYCPNHDDSDHEPEEAATSGESENQGIGGIT